MIWHLFLQLTFFPPVCSDPYEFGQIAAANSISDVYAMGGDPVLALNIMMFPAAKLPMEAYAEILKGGFDKATEAGVRIIGGHTIDDFPPKYGLAVVGYIHPEKIITNSGAKPGDSSDTYKTNRDRNNNGRTQTWNGLRR